jgi:hypothetical protein
LSDFDKTGVLSQGFPKKNSSIILYKNVSSGSRIVPSNETDRQTDITKFTAAIRDFASTDKKCDHSE